MIVKTGLKCRILSLVHKLLTSEQITTKRGLYYLDPNLFRSQQVTDRILDKLSTEYRVPRDQFNVVKVLSNPFLFLSFFRFEYSFSPAVSRWLQERDWWLGAFNLSLMMTR